MTPHKNIIEEGFTTCKVCGAIFLDGAWKNPKNVSKEVSTDCDLARASIYPRPRAKSYPGETETQRADRYQAMIIRYINAQGPHMSESWKELFIQETDLEIATGNPYEPVIARKRV